MLATCMFTRLSLYKIKTNPYSVWHTYGPPMMPEFGLHTSCLHSLEISKFEGKNQARQQQQDDALEIFYQFGQCHLKIISWYETLSMLGRNRNNRDVQSSLIFCVVSICLLEGGFMKQKLYTCVNVQQVNCQIGDLDIGVFLHWIFGIGIGNYMFSACKNVQFTF